MQKSTLYKNCQRQSCSAINCLSSGINILAAGSSVPLISESKGTDPHWKQGLQQWTWPQDLQCFLHYCFISWFHHVKYYRATLCLIGSIRGQQQHWKHLRCTHFASARQPWRRCVTSLRSAHWLASGMKLPARCPVSRCWPSCIFDFEFEK